jgi:hypothetical protein
MKKRKTTNVPSGHGPERGSPAPPPAPQKNFPIAAVVIGSVIVGGAILGGSWMLKGSLDETAARLDAIRSGLAETKQALETVAKNQGQQPAQQRRRGPDPNKRYTINTKGAPRKGPASAKVQLVEFSDFQ